MQYHKRFNLINDTVDDAFGVNVPYDELQYFDMEEILVAKGS